MRILGWTLGGAVKFRGVIEGVAITEYFETATSQTLIETGPRTSLAFWMTHKALSVQFIRIMIGWTLVFTLFTTFVAGAFLTDLFMEAETGANITALMTFSTNGFSCQGLQIALLSGIYVLPVVAIGTLVVLHQTAFHSVVFNNGQVTGFTAAGTNGVFGAGASFAGGITGATDAIIGILIFRTNRYTTIIVSDVYTLVTVLGLWTGACPTLGMTLFAGFCIKLIGTVTATNQNLIQFNRMFIFLGLTW